MLHNIPGDRNCAVRNTCIRLFKQYSGDELQLKIAENTADEWTHLYKHKVFVGREPAVSVAYRKMKQEERESYDKNHKDWDKSEEMLEWASGEHKIIQENKSNREFLEEMREHLKDDAPRRSKIDAVLSGFPNSSVKVGVATVDWNS